MKKIIFYSWQSDLPNPTNRGFIENALKKAATIIAGDSSIEVEPVIERDTEGIAGSPDISKAILDKIDKSTLFVADVSIINKANNSRPTPNPNVLIELGYAAKALGWEKIILVMNKEFGGPEFLPFDLKMRRVIPYSALVDDKNRSEGKKLLEQALEKQIRSILTSITVEPIPEPEHVTALKAIEAQSPTRIPQTRTYMKFVNDSLEKIYPGRYTGSQYDELVVKSIERANDFVVHFAEIIEVVVTYDDEPVLKEVFQDLKRLLEHYNLSRGFSGHFYDAEFDFYKFIGHDLFTTMVCMLLREQKWELLRALLNYRIVVSNAALNNPAMSVDFQFIGSFHLTSFGSRDQRFSRLSTRADVLKQVHSETPLKTRAPFEDYLGADFFLFLKSRKSNDQLWKWIPWSSALMNEPPYFLAAAQSKEAAKEIMSVLGFSSHEEFKTAVIDCASELSKFWQRGIWRNPIDKSTVELIGNYP